MWPFSSSKSSSAEAAAHPPLRNERKQCWESRDAYFACLDRAGVVQAGTEQGGACKAESSAYGKNCAQSWIDYFNQRRILAEAQKQRLASAKAQNEGARR
ncbi:hypothetical protein CYLTODRAFT_359798 [Cylindrobasidium torrendii FP15055 ss-10]|uniref:Cytochrome oxidase c subunit VIb n=1 Tax=Cylindrobasidium torrendii FP15055 ss-10 TaxID=1314674 RepID=A0A0D7B007_9AGAR|nr:hypothetical protein CYLTODRAFT_359798 [Cylindrobasidium torrendii FP15055 ss-10]